jgi:beta-lactam-binding protein with PASTA domain/tRNA A-37 threonylcarbamoyl transferase component Bud32
MDSELVGRVLDGRYRVDARIAVGGMATVYRATDTRLDRVLALKVMHPSLAADRVFVERFIREAKAVAALTHPNVVGVFDQGADGGYVYLAMEYVPGCTLRDVLRERGALQPRAALDVLEPMLAALGAAHRAGLVHRDMKPENVLIGDDGSVKVADFGLVRAVGTRTSAGSDTVLGTVSYLAPEQIEHGVADARTDLYACGVLLYEMLTGGKPHHGDTPAQIIYQHLERDVPAPSASVPGLAGVLDDLVARAAARGPGQRPSDAAALLAEVRAARAGMSDAELDALPPQATAPADGDAGPAPTRALTRPVSLTPAPAGPEDATTRLPGAPGGGRSSGGRRGGALGAAFLRGRTALVAAAVAVVVLLGAGVWYVSAGQFTHTPAVLAMSEGKARSTLQHAGLDVRVRHAYSTQVKRGHVISSDPEPGDRIRDTGTVTIVVSRGPKVVAVPDVTGSSLGDARQALRDAGLEPGRVTHEFDEDVTQGSVVRTEPGTGTKRRPGSGVALVVSKGAKIQVPDVTGQDVEDARDVLQEAGLRVRVSHDRVFSQQDKGTVAEESPGSGETSARGDTVTLTVSKGPQTVRVPDVDGLSEDDARKALEDAGFEVTVHRIFFGDTVFHQSPGGDSSAPKGGNVTIWLR